MAKNINKNKYNDRRRIFAMAVAIILVVAMIIPLALYAIQ